MLDKERLVKLLAEYGISDRYIDDLCDEVEECFAPVLADAEKWRTHQRDLALADAETERFVTLIRAEEDELRRDAEKWRKVEEIASYSKEGEWACPPNCPCDACRNVHDDFDCDIAKSLVDALSEVPHG